MSKRKHREITPSVSFVDGNLLTYECDVLVQQCNCITINSLGLSKSITQRFGVDPYAHRKPSRNPRIADEATSDVPGTISFHPIENQEHRHVANLYAQYTPGSLAKNTSIYHNAREARGIQETPELREAWFEQCLRSLAEHLDESEHYRIAFPHGIGCGLAGGNWAHYRAMIVAWAKKHPSFCVSVVKLNS